MRYFSTFSGVGGFELGIQQAYESRKSALSARNKSNDHSNEYEQECTLPTCIGYSEIDKYAIQVYNKHFNHKNYGDITIIDEKTLPDFDLFVGGFPCQSFSIAGKRKGFDDTRGTMFFEIARIVREKQPRILLLENVKGLLSHDKGSTFYTIIRTLDELGYDCQWQVLNSKNHGVPQNRERVFIVGHLRGTSRPEVFPITGADGQNIKVKGYLNDETWKKRNESIRRVYDTDGIAPTIPTGTGGGVMPKIQVPEATKKGYAEATVGQSINLAVPNSKTRRGRVSDIAQTLDTGMQQHTLTEDAKIRRLTPKECERLQGFPEIEKYDIIEVCKDNQKKNVNVEDQNHKSQKIVGSVEKKDSQENAKYVVKFLNTKNQQTNKLVQPSVLINCEESGVEIHSQGKLLLNAKYAEKKNWCHQHIKIEDFVQMLVGINTILEKITNYGEVELQKNERCLTLQKNGKKLESKFGKEITQSVGNVENDLITLKKLLKSTTSDHLDTENLEQRLAILSSFVIRAIIGYIPSEIKNQNTFTIAIKNKYGWTAQGTDGEISDTQRYKMCGNAVTVNVIQSIIEKIYETSKN